MKRLTLIFAFVIIGCAHAEVLPPQVELTKVCFGIQQPMVAPIGGRLYQMPYLGSIPADKGCYATTEIQVSAPPLFVANPCIYMEVSREYYDQKRKRWIYIPAREKVDQHCQAMRNLQDIRELNQIDPKGKSERDKLALRIMCADVDMRKALDILDRGYCKY
jgi:hypothetical protein